jgi:tetratricopeptide (TPR) repeat protein
VDSFRKAQALEPEICEYRLNLAQSLFFVATEQSLNLIPNDGSEAEAKAIVDSTSNKCSSSQEAFALRMRALLAGRSSTGSDLINRAIDLDPTDPMNWVVLGYLNPASPRLVTSDGSGRWLAMTHAAQLKSDSALIQYELGKNSSFFAGKRTDARQALEHAIAINPRHFRAYLTLAGIADNGTAMESDYLKAVEIAPQSVEARMSLGNYYASLDEVERAKAQYSAVIAINPKFDNAYFRLGQLLLQSERTGEADVEFKEVVRLNPEGFEAYYNLGTIALGEGRLDQAKSAYEHAIQTHPDYADAEFGLGQVYRREHQTDLAALQFDKAIKLNPSYADAYMARAEIHMELRQLAEAAADYRKASAAYADQIKPLDASITRAEAQPQSRVLQTEKKRAQREKARIEALRLRAETGKVEAEETTKSVQ